MMYIRSLNAVGNAAACNDSINGSWGILAGLVSITAGCGSMECGSACFTGFMGALVYQGPSDPSEIKTNEDILTMIE